jgi:tetratricopeptide (TPR) repeat protein
MICPNLPQNFRLSIFIGAAALILCGYSVFFVRAESASKQEVLQTEEKANQLALLWQEDAVRQASELFQKAARDWETLKNLKNSAECLRETAKLKILLSEEKSALPLLEKSLRYEKAGNNLEGEADTLSLLTIILTRLGENAKSGFYQQKALKVAGQTKKQKQMAFALTASGQYFYGQREFQMMLRQQEKALELFREIGDKKAEAEILVELAYSYIINNDRIRGRDTAINALKISKDTGNLRNQVFSLIVLGDSYQRMGEAENALKTLSEAKRLFTPDLDFFDKAVLYNRLGHYYQSYNELDEAKRHFQISYNFFEKAKSIEGRSETLTVLGKISILQNNLDEALDYFSQSRGIAEKSGDEMPLAVVNLRIGEVNLKLADYAAAEILIR